MQKAQQAYVEKWDATEFPYFRDRSGLRFWRERVVATGDGEVLKGHLTIANAIAEAWCKDNPVLFAALLDAWMETARAADDEDRESRRREDERLAYHPQLAMALEHGPAGVFELAGLTAHQARVLELRFNGKTFAEIGLAFGFTKQTAAEYVARAIEKILAIDARELDPDAAIEVKRMGTFKWTRSADRHDGIRDFVVSDFRVWREFWGQWWLTGANTGDDLGPFGTADKAKEHAERLRVQELA